MENTQTAGTPAQEPEAGAPVVESTAGTPTAPVPAPVAEPTAGTPTAPVANPAAGTPVANPAIAPAPVPEVVVPPVTLYNTAGVEVPVVDYLFKGVTSPGFEGTCGKPVDREDLLGVFNKVFKPSDNVLFYKQRDKEVYLVIVPIKYSTEIGDHNDSLAGDFQKHAISFLNEGSVNLETMREKLERINSHVKYSDR